MKGLGFRAYPCYQESLPECSSESYYQTMINLYVRELTFLKGQFYLFNTGFNPQEKNPVINYLDSNIILPFTSEFGTNMVV